MDTSSLWTRFQEFVKSCFKEKFKIFFPGCIVGLFSAKSLLFAGLPSELVTFGAYCVKFAGTALMAFGSGLGTTAGAKYFERIMKKYEKKNPNPSANGVKKKKRA